MVSVDVKHHVYLLVYLVALHKWKSGSLLHQTTLDIFGKSNNNNNNYNNNNKSWMNGKERKLVSYPLFLSFNYFRFRNEQTANVNRQTTRHPGKPTQAKLESDLVHAYRDTLW